MRAVKIRTVSVYIIRLVISVALCLLAGGNILIVGHAGSLDACFRQLCGKSPRNSMEFHEILNQFPYCCLAMATEDLATKRWTLKEPPIPSVCHGGNKIFSWKVLQ